MTTRVTVPTTTWRKSRRSAQDTSCVEVRGDLAAVQDTKRRGPHLTVDVTALVAAVKAGRIGA